LVIAVTLALLSRQQYFKGKGHILSLVILQSLVTCGFNIFNIYRYEQMENTEKATYWRLNSRYSQYIAIFFVDILLVGTLMMGLLMLRAAELETLVRLGVYKNVENLTDKEMFSEYDKLKKQSLKLQKRIRKIQRQKERLGITEMEEDESGQFDIVENQSANAHDSLKAPSNRSSKSGRSSK
jgi:HD superfamily phosphohydrolase